MAQFNRTSGDLKPVVVVDSPVGNTVGGAGQNSGANAIVSQNTVNPAGPKLDFGTVTVTGAATVVSTASGSITTSISNDTLAAIMQIIQSRATVALYDITLSPGNGAVNTTAAALSGSAVPKASIAVATYPTGAWDFGANANSAINLNNVIATAGLPNPVVVVGSTAAGTVTTSSVSYGIGTSISATFDTTLN